MKTMTRYAYIVNTTAADCPDDARSQNIFCQGIDQDLVSISDKTSYRKTS